MGRERKRLNGEGSIFQRPNGTFVGTITLGFDAKGNQKRRTVYGKSVTEVQKKLTKLKAAKATDTLVDINKTTVESHLNQWLQNQKHSLRPNSYHQYQHIIKRINQHIGKRLIQKLTPNQVAQTIQYVLEHAAETRAKREKNKTTPTGNTPGASSAVIAHRILKAALEQAVQWKIIPANPAAHVPKPRLKHKTPQIWEPEQIKQFLDTIQTQRIYPIFYVAFTTGMRKGEILGLRWQDFDGQALTIQQAITTVAGKWHITEPKTQAANRVIPLPPDTIEVLREHRKTQAAQKAQALQDGRIWEEHGLIFTTATGKPIHPRDLGVYWTQGIRKAGLPHIRIHDIRHTFASLAISQGVDVKQLSEVLGHANTSMTLNTYSHVFAKAKRTSILNLPALIDHIPTKTPEQIQNTFN